MPYYTCARSRYAVVLATYERGRNEYAEDSTRSNGGRLDLGRVRNDRSGPADTTTADRDYEGRGHRQRLHLPQRKPSVDVHRDQRWGDRDRSDRVWPTD